MRKTHTYSYTKVKVVGDFRTSG